MKKETARKLPEYDSELSRQSNRPVQLFVSKKENPAPDQETVYLSKRFRGDLVVYFLAIGIWFVGTIWLVVKLIDSFF
jgi:hypothetical protein